MAEEPTETPIVEEPVQKKSKGMLWILGLAVLLLAGGGAAWFFMVSSSPEPSGEAEPTAETLIFFSLDHFLVNLANSDGRHYLRAGIDLGLEHEVEADEEELALLIALVRDTILLVLATWESDALLTLEGKKELKGELLGALHNRVPELGVAEIYFNDFLVQR